MQMILIVTAPTDPHADAVEGELDRRGASYVRFDPADFPTKASLDVRLGATGLRRVLRTRETQIDLDAVTAVWFRRPGPSRPDQHLTGWVAGLVAHESTMMMADLWETLEVFAMPAPRPVVLRAQYKLRQLQLAAELGFELPDTSIGNDPDALLAMFDTHGGRLVTKQIGPTQLGETPDGDPALRYTEPVRHRDLVHASGLRLCPMIVQAYVPKALELRVTVVGARVFAAAIDSQRANHTRHDWRRYDDANTLTRRFDLPDEVAARCVALTRRLGLCYGAIDLVLTPEGRYVFLEINPSGQYRWIEEATGLPITSAIADLLMGACAPAA
jgi:glutathione synthase/RimK-type ligase-like ATP-grasp enzyme